MPLQTSQDAGKWAMSLFVSANFPDLSRMTVLMEGSCLYLLTQGLPKVLFVYR